MFRTCDITGFKVDLKAQQLIRLNAVFAVISLLGAVIAALLLVFTRYQPVHLLSSEWYYRLVTYHGVNALIFWIVFFEIAGLYFGSTVVLNIRFCAPRLGWLSLILMVAGFILTDIMILAGKADVMMTSYTPLKADPLYYLGIILFAVGALLGVVLFFGNLMIARQEKAFGDTMPLFTYGMMTAAIIAFITLVTGAIIYIPTFLWSLGLIENVDAGMYKLIWWGLGHSSQQINVAAMVSIWYLGSFLAVGGTSINERISRLAFVLYIMFICLASAHHLLTDPGLSSAWKVWNTSYAMYLAVLASMIHAFAVPSSIESAQRRWGYNKGLFEWLVKAPWSNPAFSSIVLACIGFGFIGGTTGVIFGMEQTNIIVHNTIAIPGHFKGTVVIGTTLTFMGVTYYLIPLIFRRKIVGLGWARWQPWMFFFGIALLSVSMIVLGQLGVPRRHWDSTFSGGPFTYNFNPATDFFWTLMMLGGTLAFLATLIWILIVVISVFFGPKVNGPEDMQLPISALAPEGKRQGKYEAPGTLILTLAFLATFLILFFLNWKWLAATWGVY
ncbi:MAG: cytochrome c oxidase subunit I [Haliscomenobacteraceae bacterium CHB4]|nr:cytochrome c oxidase subunit 1 [Saprospiraceae bacterium]MCE7924562.1 cytochrome c oxidase subunit I [Haliscomenobacteraceae bacterium CHB4]